MSFLERVTDFMLGPLQTRSIEVAASFDDFSSQLLSIRRRQAASRPWRQASIREAMGVPAINGAVNLIANLVGSMSMKAFRNEMELRPDERPRLIVRPDPFSIPREFYRSTAYNLASRGETWWWTAAKDSDGNALSLLNIPPHEVMVEEDPKDLRYPVIRWRDKVMRNEDFRQLVYSREPGELRGVGPLQLCGAAISVAVESQEWAANYFAEGGVPSIVIKSAVDLDATKSFDADGNPGTDYSEADVLRNQWTEKPHNVPRVIDPGIESITEFGGGNAQGAQMLSSRDYQNGEVARMFHIPGSLLEYAVAGSSLTYQNVGMEFEKLLRQCLRPDYLEVMEQTITDSLTRSTVARFNTDSLTLADIKTRYEVYGLGIDKGIIDAEEARRFEGLASGDVENASVPFSPPQAIPGPIQTRSSEIRCDGVHTKRRGGIPYVAKCNRLLSTTGSFSGQCPRCKKAYQAPVEPKHDFAIPKRLVAPVLPQPVMRSEPEVVTVIEHVGLTREEVADIVREGIASIPRPEPVVVGPTSDEVSLAVRSAVDQAMLRAEPREPLQVHIEAPPPPAFNPVIHFPDPRFKEVIDKVDGKVTGSHFEAVGE